MNAYTYFKNLSLSVEPDMPVEAAGEKEDTEEIIVSKDALTVSETENPIDTLNNILSDTSDSEEITVSQDGNVIALIDTGVGESANVIDRVSVIEEPEMSTEHGDAMLQAIVSQNPDAKILSIRAMNSNGFGTISSLVAAMEYAISENVDMINLSLYARTTLSTSVLKSEIQKAVDAGITVIGAAGNDGVDVMDYVPGSVEPAYIIGAAKEDGSRLETSNFGTTVDYNVVAESTSEATALFTGYISKNGLDKVSEVLNQGMIFETGFGGEEPEISTKEWNQSECNLVSAQYDRTKGAVRLEDLDVPGWLLLTVDSQEGYFIKDVILSDSNMVYYPYEVSAFGEYSQFAFRIPQEHLRIEISYVNNSDDIPEVSFPNSYTPDKQHLVNIEKDTQELRKSDILYHNLETGDSRGNQVINVIGGEILGEDNIQAASWESQSTNFVTGGRINYEGHVTTWMWADDRIAFCARPNAPTPPMGTYKFDSSWQNPWDIYSRLMYCMYGGEGFESSGVKSLFQQFGWTSSEQQYAYSHVIMTLAGNNPAAIDQDNFDRNSFSPSCFTGLSNASVDNVLYVVHHIVRNVKTVPAGFKTVMFARDTPYQAVFGSYAAPAKGGLSVQKASADTTITNGNTNYSLAGAQYGIWNNASCSGNPLLTITTDGNGYAKTAEDALDAGTYYVKETKASPGYDLDPTIHTKVVVAGDPGIGNSVQSKEPPKTGEGELEKKSDNPAMTDGNKCYTLAGAVYGVWKNSSCSGTPWKRMTTDAKGHAKVDKLPFGNYWVKEITPSKGFELDTNIYPISVTEANPKAKINSVEPAGNDPMVITINKIWNGPETPTIPPLAGTQFTVKYFDNLNKNTSGNPKKTWVLEVKQNKVNGKWMAQLDDNWLVKDKSDPLYKDPRTGGVVLPYGTYWIKETQHAPGYTFEGTWGNKDGSVSMSTSEPYITVVDKTTSGGINLWGGNEYTGHNKPHDTSIKIRKVDENGRPLAGAKFKLVDSKGKLISTKTSGSDGYVTWDKLYPDIYTVTEIQAPNGKNLLAEDIEIHLPMRITEEDIKKYNIDRSKLSEWDKEEQCYYLFDVTYEISNHATFKAPMTGGFTNFMTFLPLVGGMAGFAGVGAVAMKRKRKKGE